MTEVAICDDRGRVTLGKEIVERYGRKFSVVTTPKEVVLIPVIKNPLNVFEKEGKKLPKGMTLEGLKRVSEEQAAKEALGNLGRLKLRRR